MSAIKILEKHLYLGLALYLDRMDAKGITASGRTRRESIVAMRENGGRIDVPLYNQALRLGRSPNSNQDPESLKGWVGWAGSTFLKQWVIDKGLNISPYAVAWKIAKEGWEIPASTKSGRMYNDGKLLEESFTDEWRTNMLQEIGNHFNTRIINTYKSWQS